MQRIHGFYAFFDWLAYHASRRGVELDLGELTRQGYKYLLEQSANPDALLAFKDYLRRAFDISAEALTRVMSNDPDGFLWRIFYSALVKPAQQKFERDQLRKIDPRELLREHLPENLFSDINLPEVQVDYRPDDRGSHKRPSYESISLAVSETMPGNVTFRGGVGATWVPPTADLADGDRALIALSRYYVCEPLSEHPKTVNLPARALRLVGIVPQQTRELVLYRPSAIRPVQFSRDHNSSFWWANPESGELREYRGTGDAGQDVTQLAHSSSAYPINAVELKPERDTATRAYTFTSEHSVVTCDPLGLNLVGSIILYSDETSNMNLLDVRRIVLGSQYTLKFHESRAEEIRGVLGFTSDEDSDTSCALGYQITTEGISLDLAPRLLGRVCKLKIPEYTICYGNSI